jgi:hypothetical protein
VTREITVWYKDTTPPETAIMSAVDGNGQSISDGGVTLSTSVTFTVTGTDDLSVSRFECRLDGSSFGGCAHRVQYSGLGLGHHQFEVRAVDYGENRDSTPARQSFTIDAAPNTTITKVVDGRGQSVRTGDTTRTESITFRFAGTDNGSIAGFECRIDTASFTPCTSPATYASGSTGTHTFQVHAIDNNGFQDPTPAVFTWRRR